MENYTYWNSKPINFIRIAFWILFTFIVFVLILLFVIQINDTVKIQKGEILAKKPSINYLAPFESLPDSIYIIEGQYVEKGDTLMTVTNSQIAKDLKDNVDYIEGNNHHLRSIQANIVNIRKKISQLKTRKNLEEEKYDIDTKKLKMEVEKIYNQVLLLKEKEKLAIQKLKQDSSLYKSNVISIRDLRESYDTYLNYKDALLQAKNNEKEIKSKFREIRNNYLQEKNNTEIQITELNNEKEKLNQDFFSTQSQLKNYQNNFDYIESEIKKQYILSRDKGVVSQIYNVKSDQTFFSKGELLLAVSPLSENFYVKAQISEKDIKYVKLGQIAHLKLDAYYYYEYGALKGIVKHIPDRKTEEPLSILVTFSNSPKFPLKAGYSLNGEIIIDRMSLIKYTVKNLLDKSNVFMNREDYPSRKSISLSTKKSVLY